MKKRIKKKWLAALRSGKYKQGKGQLRDEDNNFCCLGVLCNIHAQENPEIAKHELDPIYYLGDEGTLPQPVMEWAGLSEELPQVTYRGEGADLAELNDGEGLSFKQIANVIDRCL